jgi:glycerol-3-phosphate acyltransferase PlsY
MVASYLVGAFPTAELVGRAYGRDVLHEGSGNPGATNTYRVAGPRAAAAVMVADVAKGAITATAAGRWGGTALGAACGLAAVIGHCFPPTIKATGGKGVATTAGMLVAIDPPLGMAAAAAWAAAAKGTGKASVASIGTAALLPAAAHLLHRPKAEVVAVTAASAIIVIRHAGNIRRLVRGQEQQVHAAGSHSR